MGVSRFVLAGLGAIVTAQAASAQLTLAIDIQGIDYQFRDAGGNAAFGGLTHTGTLEWSGASATTADTRMGSDGRFGVLTPVSQTIPLKEFAGVVTFENGLLTGGSISVTLDNSEEDAYTASIKAGSGQLWATNKAGYIIDGLTYDGAFSDAMWGDVDVGPWHAAQTGAGALPGAFFKFRFWPTPQASGTADVEVFVMVPLPPAALAGSVMMGGLGAWGYVRRRRNAIIC